MGSGRGVDVLAAPTPLTTRIADWWFGGIVRADRHRTRELLGVVALFFLGVVILLARIPRIDWNTLWAEDGPVFLAGAVRDGWASVVQPYSGYLHVAPRLLALLANVAPLEIVPAVMTVLAVSTVSALACAVFVLLRGRIRAITVRLAAWLAAFALPIMGGEVLGSLANVHWFLLIAAFCAAATRPRSGFQTAVQVVVLCGAVLSDPLTLLLVPILGARWWLTRARSETMIGAWFCVAATVQVVATVGSTLAGERNVSTSRPSLIEYAEFFGVRTAATGLLGVSPTVSLAQAWGAWLAWAALVFALSLLIAGAVLAPDHRAGIILFAGASAVFAGVVWSLQWDFFGASGVAALNTGERYAVVPVSLFVISMLIAADGVIRAIRLPSGRRITAALVLVSVLIPVVADMRVWAVRADTPSWSAQARDAIRACEKDAKRVEFLIAPASMGFRVGIPCARITNAPRSG